MAREFRKMLFKDQAPDPILTELREVCQRLNLANQRFSLEKDGDLIEACIYEQEALRARYRYLLKVARERRVTAPLAGLQDTDVLPAPDTSA